MREMPSSPRVVVAMLQNICNQATIGRPVFDGSGGRNGNEKERLLGACG